MTITPPPVPPSSDSSETPVAAPSPIYHKARLFLPLNNGSALVYELEGESKPPKAEGLISRTIETHKNEIVILNISNWLSEQQRFEVSWELSNGESPEEAGLLVSGAQVVDLMPHGKMDYKLSVRALKKGDFSVRVWLRNLIWEEFMFFDVSLEVGSASELETLKLHSVVREKISTVVMVRNVLSRPVTIDPANVLIKGTKEVHLAQQEPLYLKEKDEAALEICYRPLRAKENLPASLVIDSPDLGLLEFNLLLSAEMEQEKPIVRLNCHLGEKTLGKFDFRNFAGQDVLFSVKVLKLDENLKQVTQPADFSVESSTFSARGVSQDTEGTLNTLVINYEPSLIGVSKALLTLSSEEGGDYEVLLIGKGENPTPKGPYKIGSKGSTPIEFKNPFFHGKEFTLKFENQSFSSSVKSQLRIDSRKCNLL